VKIDLTVNGLKVQAQYHVDEIENVHKPLLRMLAALQTVNPQRRTVVFLCAPPGTGKSTLTTFWEYLTQQDPELPTIQTLPMDGFHHYNNWLDAHQLRPFKGAPETFNVAKLVENLRQVMEGDCTWPQYDRQKHEPVEDALHVTAPLVIVEGNWLLLDDEKWCQLAQFCDFSILSTRQLLRCRNDWWGASWREGYRWQTQKPFMTVPMGRMFAGCWKRVCLQI